MKTNFKGAIFIKRAFLFLGVLLMISSYADATSVKGAKTDKGPEADGSYYKWADEDAMWGLQFDALTDMKLLSVKVYNGVSELGESYEGLRTLTVISVNDDTIASAAVNVVLGEQRLILNMSIPAGTGYRLISDVQVGFWRDKTSDNENYPYAVGDIATVTADIKWTGGGITTNQYHFFYDWEVEVDPPDTAELTAVIDSSSAVITGVTIGDAVGEYTQAKVDAANAALVAAEAALAGAVSQAGVGQATADLRAAMELFAPNEPLPDTTELLAVIDSSKAVIAGATIGDAEGEYTQVRVDAANAAIATAEAAKAAVVSGTTQAEVDQATAGLRAAMELFVAQLAVNTIYVDPLLSADCTGNYSVANRDCSGSDGDAYKSITSAANAAIAGTRVLIREGVYQVKLSPKYSGMENAYITFKNYGDEVVELTGESLAPAIWIEEKNFIVIEGLYIHDVNRWLNVLGSHHIIIRNNKFENATNQYGSSKTGLFFQACNHIKILDNVITESTQDNIGMIDCDYNLIEGNTITKAVHVLWTLKCSNYTIIRGNYFHNELQKIGEVYDCDEVGYGEGSFPKITSLDDTKYNVVEDNIFAYTASSGDSSPYSGIQYAGQNGIIRNNVFYECVGPPLSLTIYSDEAQYNYSNRISHNVFYDNDFGGLDISGSDGQNFSDQQIKNNIFYKNQFIQNDSRWSWFEELDNKPVQILTGRTSDVLIENNNIFSSEEDELYVVAYGSRSSSSNPAPESLSWWEANHSELFKSNLQANPDFVDEGNKDFHLKEDSPMIDAATFLTSASSSGSDALSMQVDDAGWFMDGFGIKAGDAIQLEGQSTYAIIVSIDYSTGTLTLDRALSWEAGQGVGMKYEYDGPDIGAFEYSPFTSKVDWQVPDEEKINIFPNPTSGVLHVEVASKNHIDKVIVYNSLGQSVVQSENSNELDISGLGDGMYYVNVFTRNGKVAKAKVLKY